MVGGPALGEGRSASDRLELTGEDKGDQGDGSQVPTHGYDPTIARRGALDLRCLLGRLNRITGSPLRERSSREF